MAESCTTIIVMKSKALVQKLEKEKTNLMGQLINKYHNELWHDIIECAVRLAEIDFTLTEVKQTFKEELEYKFENE